MVQKVREVATSRQEMVQKVQEKATNSQEMVQKVKKKSNEQSRNGSKGTESGV